MHSFYNFCCSISALSYFLMEILGKGYDGYDES